MSSPSTSISRPERAEAGGDAGDPVGFLVAQLARAADRRRAARATAAARHRTGISSIAAGDVVGRRGRSPGAGGPDARGRRAARSPPSSAVADAGRPAAPRCRRPSARRRSMIGAPRRVRRRRRAASARHPGGSRPRRARTRQPRRRRARARRSPAPSSLLRSSATAPSALGRLASTSTPRARSIRSVWSRVATDSRTVVRPSARKPRQQDRRLHLRARAPASSQSIGPERGVPDHGQGREGVVAVEPWSTAPIAPQWLDDTSAPDGGATTRRRRGRPSSAGRRACPATSRRLVPELPQSRIAGGLGAGRPRPARRRRSRPSGRRRRAARPCAPRAATIAGRRTDVGAVAGAADPALAVARAARASARDG